jgi:hypothetical protein
MVDPFATHIVTSEHVNQHNVTPATRTDNKLRIATSESLNLNNARNSGFVGKSPIRQQNVIVVGISKSYIVR